MIVNLFGFIFCRVPLFIDFFINLFTICLIFHFEVNAMCAVSLIDICKTDISDIQSFSPLVDAKTTKIIIGTMPGIASLNAQEYYAHPRNAFWKIISCLFNQSHNFSDYKNKCSCLLSHNIGLWDSLQTCSRIGSLDANITHEIPNNFNLLFEQYSQINKMLFNGQAAYKFFKKYHPFFWKK